MNGTVVWMWPAQVSKPRSSLDLFLASTELIISMSQFLGKETFLKSATFPGERALKMGFPASKNCSGEKIFKGTYPLSTPGSSNRILTNHKKKTHHLEFTLGKWIRVSSYDFDKLLVKCSWKTCPYINEHENYENYFPSAYKQPKNVLYDRSKTTVWRRARKKLTGAIK